MTPKLFAKYGTQSGIENSIVFHYTRSQTNEVRDDFDCVLPTRERNELDIN